MSKNSKLNEFIAQLQGLSDHELTSVFLSLETLSEFNDEEKCKIAEAIRIALNKDTPRRTESDSIQPTFDNFLDKSGSSDHPQGAKTFDERLANARKLLKGLERSYSFNIVTYQLDPEYLVNIKSNAKHWISIKHDKDETAPHIHLLVTFKNHVSPLQCFDMLDHVFNSDNGQCNTVVESNKDIVATVKYFLHDGYANKAQYEPDALEMDDSEYWNSRYISKTHMSTTDKNDMFIDDLLTKNVTFMCHKYGRDFMVNMVKYLQVKRVLQYEAGEDSWTWDAIFDLIRL